MLNLGGKMEVQHKKCPVCKEEFAYYDVHEIPATCGKRMCRQNYFVHLNKMTAEGDSPSLERLGTWNLEKKK